MALMYCLHCNQPYQSGGDGGWLCAACFAKWITNPDRFVHGTEAEYNERRVPIGSTRYIVLDDGEAGKEVTGRPMHTQVKVSPIESTNWSGSWDNIVRWLEGG